VSIICPRFSPTCEWDTAAGDAILHGVGGELKQLDGTPLKYGKSDILNPNFIGTSGKIKMDI
jgi:3'(2'), 5'-bisphosphate nucleotidase